MSIINEIGRIKNNIINAYQACEEKGTTLPEKKNIDNLSDCIASIPDKVSTEFYITRGISNGSFGYPVNNFSCTIPNGINTVGDYGLYFAFYLCTSLASIDSPSLTSVGEYGMYYAFNGCTALESANFPSLTSIGTYGLYYAFKSCTSLASIDFSSLTSVEGNGLYQAFYGCTALTSADFSSLVSIGASGLSNAFYGCTALKSINFPSLTSTSFGSYKTQFSSMLESVTGCTVHFPSNLNRVIGSWSNVTSGFGGTNTVVLFDLPATT